MNPQKKSVTLLVFCLITACNLYADKPLLILDDSAIWSSSTPPKVAQNLAHIKTLPIDGIIMNSYVQDFMNWSQNDYYYTNFMAAFAPISQSTLGSSTNLTFNLASVKTRRPGDFFDDTAWIKVSAKFADYTRMCKDKGWAGIWFDTEEYSATNNQLFLWPNTATTSHIFDEYVVKAKERGKQVMTAIVNATNNYANMTFSVTYGPEIYARAVTNQWGTSAAQRYRLLAAFTEGLWENRGSSMNFIWDGEAYRNTNWNDFNYVDAYQKAGYSINKYGRAFTQIKDPFTGLVTGFYDSFLPIASRDAFVDSARLNTAVTDYDDSQPGRVPLTSQETQDRLTWGLRRADKYCWYYNEVYDWLVPSASAGQPQPPPAAIKTAVANARATATSRIPGTSWFSETFENGAADWVNEGGAWIVTNTTRNGASTKVYQKAANSQFLSIVTGDAAPGGRLTWTDYSIQSWVRIPTATTADCYIGIVTRAQDFNNCFALRLTQASGVKNWTLAKKKNGVWTWVNGGNYSWAFNTWYMLRVVVSGRDFNCQVSTDGIAWTNLGTFKDYDFVSGKVGVVGNTIGEFDDVRVIVPDPEANVTGNAVSIVDGDTSPSTTDGTDFGSTHIASGQEVKTYTIQNTGTASLTVESVTLSGANAADFAVTVQPAKSLTVGGNTTFKVRFDPSATGTRSASVSFNNNDSSENPYNFSINGTGANLPAPWTSQDIGAVGVVGNAYYSGGTYTVIGSGAEIYGSADEFRYVYQSASGDCEITARVSGQQNSNPSAKAGVMIRQNLNANSQNANMTIMPNGQAGFFTRSSAGGSTVSAGITSAAVPKWLRVKRVGNTFTGYWSNDGVAWYGAVSKNITMTGAVYIGLAVTSAADGTLCRSTFDNVTSTP